MLAALVLLAAMALPAAGRAAPAPRYGDGPYRVQLVYRTGSSLAPFDLTLVASTDNDYGMWYLVHVRRVGDRWVPISDGVGGFFGIAGTLVPAAYGLPTKPPGCPDTPGCRYPVPIDGSIRFTVKPTPTSRLYLVSTSAHTNLRVELDTKGWKVKDIPNPGVRRIFAQDAQSTGGGLASSHVEHFTSASAPGGRYGSEVFATVPCDYGGTGSAWLTARGLDEPRHLRCGRPFTVDNYDYAYSPVQTVWQLKGDVTGIGSSGYDRLFVFDFPKP